MNAPQSGYAHPAYADALSEFGEPRRLPGAGGWILRRPIRDSPWSDAMACYPLFSCTDWSALQADLDGLAEDCIAVSLVADPFGDFTTETLRDCFPDVCFPFKQHFIADLSRPAESFIAANHLRYSRKALKDVEASLCDKPQDDLEDWLELYGCLVERHAIRGIAAFSRASFAKQFAVPGLVAFRARRGGQTAGMLLWYLCGDIAYYHLGAYTEAGYEARASYALFRTAIVHFQSLGVRWLALGAGAGVEADASDGLTRFKRGWSTGTRPAWFCGRILNRDVYAGLAAERGRPDSKFFPAYRAGEFA